MKKRYLVVYEKAPSNYGAFAPDVPGCASLGETLEETRRLMSEGLRFHLDMLVEDGEPVPEPTTTAYDFAEDTPENGVVHCVVEWLEVEIPAMKESHELAAAS
jgi:predicted RNase H-like HicB family nuclease